MKALEILKEEKVTLEAIFRNGCLSSFGKQKLRHINEAIAELEALQAPKTCAKCEYNQSCKILKAYIDVCDWEVDDNDFFCSEYVKKETPC